MSQFSEQVKIAIEGFTQNVIYYNLELSQKMADHYRFSFFWQYSGKTIIEPQDQEKAFSNYIGNEVIFTFKVNGIQLMSKGRITRLESLDMDGSPDGLQVFGVSHTIVLDEMPKSRIFLEKSLQQIGLEIFAEESSGEFYQRVAIVPTYIKEFKFKTQYNETSFDFLKRLSKSYAQWFYFDGMRMQFGKIKNTDIRIINESSLHKLKIEANLVSQKASFGSYEYANAANIKYGAEKTEQGSRDRFASIAGFKQPYIVRPGLQNGAYTNNAQNKEEIEEMVKMQTAGNDANSIFYSGISYLPIGLGQTFSLVNKTVEHHLLAIEIMHRSEVNGNYTCEFRAIPADAAASHYTDVNAFVATDSQSAAVIDNNDPEKMGRVKVQYYWDAYNSKSDWMRVVQNYSGTGRGTYVRPEIGDEVLVSFEGGNAERPYVSGSHFNGNALPDYTTPNNDLKALKTRSGITAIMNDAEGSVLIEDPSGNKYFMDGNGSITIDAPKNLTLNAGENININAGQNMDINVRLNKTNTIGGDCTETITGSKYLTIGINFMLKIGGNMFELIKGNKETESKDIKEMAQEVLLNTEKSISLRASKDVNSHSGENSRNY